MNPSCNVFPRLSFAAALILAGRLSAATLTVGAGPGYDHPTIQAAISAAASGDVIEIAAGTYSSPVVSGAHGFLTINKPLTLRGAGRDETFITSAGTISSSEVRSVLITAAAAGTVIEDLTFAGWDNHTGTGWPGGGYLVWQDGVADITYDNVGFDGNNIRVALFSRNASDLTIRNSRFSGHFFRQVIRGSGARLTIEDNEFETGNYLHGAIGLEYGHPTGGAIRGNSFRQSAGVTQLAAGSTTLFKEDGSDLQTIFNFNPVSSEGLLIEDNSFEFLNAGQANLLGAYPVPTAIALSPDTPAAFPVTIRGNTFEGYDFQGVFPAADLPVADAAGAYGGALRFNGTNAYAEFTQAIHNLGPKGTFSLWVKLDADATARRNQILEGPGNGGIEFQYRNNSGGQFYGTPLPAAGYQIQSGAAAAAATSWSNLQYTWDVATGQMKIYLNGSEVAYSSVLGAGWNPGNAINTTLGTMFLGRDPGDNSRFLKGALDDVALFDDVLSPADLAAVRLRTTAISTASYPALRAHWNFDSIAGTALPGDGGTSTVLQLKSLTLYNGGIRPYLISAPTGTTLSENQFLDHSGSAVVYTQGFVNAAFNYWGHPAGPPAGDLLGNVLAAPYYTDLAMSALDAPVKNVTNPLDIGYFATIQPAIDAAAAGDTLVLLPGSFPLGSGILVNKPDLTIEGPATLDAVISGTNGIGNFIQITADGVTLRNLNLQKTDKAGPQTLIYVGADNVTVEDCELSGQYVLGDPDVSRGFEVAYGSSDLSISGNSFQALRQPGYLNGSLAAPTTGTISNNSVTGTRGWVIAGARMVFTGNTWSGNAVDIALLDSTAFGPPYDPLSALIAANTGASISDQRVGPNPFSVRNLTTDLTYGTIQAAVNDATAGDVILVEPGTYAEAVVLTQSLTLRGPNHAISPNSGVRVMEAVITGSIAATTPVSSTIVIEGIHFSGASPLTSNGNAPGTVHNDFTFRRNLVNGGSAQLALFTGTPTNTASALITDNRFLAMAGNAMQLAAGSGVLEAVISDNVIDGTGTAGINSDGLTNSAISGNTFANTGQQAVQVAGASSDVTVSGNRFTNTNTSNGADRGAVRVYGTAFTGPVHVTGNVISGGNTAFAVRNGENITGKDIRFSGNSMSGVAGEAVYHGGTGELDSTLNFWGGEEGPAGNPAMVSGPVSFNPWYGASNHALPLNLSRLRNGILGNTLINTLQPNVPDLYIAPGTTVTVTPEGGLDATALELADGATLVVNGGSLAIGQGSLISGTFTVFNSFGSWDINGDTTFEIGKSLALISDIHVAAGKTLTVNGGGELVLDRCVIDSQTAGSPYSIEVEDDGLLTIARSVVSDAWIDIDTLGTSVPLHAKSRIYDSRFTASDIEAGADAAVYHNLFDAATDAAANTDATTAFSDVDGWGNVTDAGDLRNRFSLEFEAPAAAGRTLVDGNLFVQTGDAVSIAIEMGNVGPNTVTLAEALLGYNSERLVLASSSPAVTPASGWDVLIDDDSVSAPLGLVDSALALELDPGDDGISGPATVGSVNFTAGTAGSTVGFFRVQTDGNYNPDGSFQRDTRLTRSSGGIPSFLTAFTANTGELVVDNDAPSIDVSPLAVTGVQNQPTTGSVNVLLPAGARVIRDYAPVVLTFSAADTGLSGLDAADADSDLVLTADNGLGTVLDADDYTVSAVESSGTVTYTVQLDVPSTAGNGTYLVTATVRDRSGNFSAPAGLGSFQVANEVLATVELQGFVGTGPGSTRDVVFVATGGASVKTWTKTVSFTASAGTVVLDDVPAGTTGISAKTAWTLRSKKAVILGPTGVGTVSLTGADKLNGGDYNGDNVVNTLDYSILRFNWLTANAVADITGNGSVNSNDYNILTSNFYTVGDLP